MRKHLERWFHALRRYSDRWWYAPFVAFTAFLDLFVIVIPTDALLISSVMLSPRRWFLKAGIVALGSSLGAWTLAFLLHEHGLPLLLRIAPDVQQTRAWGWSQSLMDNWGNWAIFLISLSPIMQHPIIALAALAGVAGWKVFGLVFVARVLKYGFLAWMATHAPKLLNRLWGIQGELKEVGIGEEAENESPSRT